ncbi:MAG TPA: hypothetical protein PLU47_07155 [Azonexus sp.]|nr:hypothetical protein [Azonexus sp.]
MLGKIANGKLNEYFQLTGSHYADARFSKDIAWLHKEFPQDYPGRSNSSRRCRVQSRLACGGQ